MKASNMSRADFMMSLVLILFGTTVLVMSIGMPRFEELNVNPYSVPGIVPGFLGVIICALGVVLFVRSILRGGHRLGINRQALVNYFGGAATRRLLLTLAICLAYAFGMLDRTPYLVATIVFIFAFIVAFEFRRDVPLGGQLKMLGVAVLVSGIAGTSIWAVFRYLFLVNLPG